MEAPRAGIRAERGGLPRTLRFWKGAPFMVLGESKPYPFRCGVTYATIFGELGFLVLQSDSGRSEDTVLIEARAPQTIPKRGNGRSSVRLCT